MKTTNKVQTTNSTTSTGTSTGKTTTTITAGGSYTFPPYYQSEKGWECPRCGRINAPWIRHCDCSRNNWNITCDDTTAGDEWWKPYVKGRTAEKEWWKTSVDTFRIHPEEMATWTSVHDLNVGGSDYKDSVTGDWVNVPTTYTNSVKR